MNLFSRSWIFNCKHPCLLLRPCLSIYQYIILIDDLDSLDLVRFWKIYEERIPCRTIFSSFFLTRSSRGRGIFLALQNIDFDPTMSFTRALCPLTAVCFLSHTVLMPSWGSMYLPSSPIFLSECTTASCCCLCLLPYYSSSHVRESRRFNWPPSKASSCLIFPSKVYQAKSKAKMTSQSYIDLNFCSIVFYFRVLQCRLHVKHVFQFIIHFIHHFERCLTRQPNLFLAEVVVRSDLSDLG